MLAQLSRSPPPTQTSRKQHLSFPAPPMKKRQRLSNSNIGEDGEVISKSLAAPIFIPDLPESMAFDDEEYNDKENPCPRVLALKLQPKSGPMPSLLGTSFSPFGSSTTTTFFKSSSPCNHHMASSMSSTMPSLISLHQRRMNSRDPDQQEVYQRMSALRF